MVRSARNTNLDFAASRCRALVRELARLRRRLHTVERHNRINEEYFRRANEREHAEFVTIQTANCNLRSRFHDLAQQHSDALDTFAEVDGCREEHDRRRRVLWQIRTRPDETLAQMSARAEIQGEFIKSQRDALDA